MSAQLLITVLLTIGQTFEQDLKKVISHIRIGYKHLLVNKTAWFKTFI